MEIRLILEPSKQGKSHTTHLKEAVQMVYQWLKTDGMQAHVVMQNQECQLTLHCQHTLSPSQMAHLAQSVANTCQTNVRLPMVFRNGSRMEMQYQAMACS